MEANNNLKYDALNSVNGMEQGALNIDGILLVYIKTTNRYSYLLKIKHDTNRNKIASDTVKTFENENFSGPENLKDVVLFSQSHYPSSSYGLILWSHATSWAPSEQSLPKVKSFGYDRGREMDIIELKEALPNNLDFIIFDACSMASLEVLFELKDKAKYILASPSETIADSYPYETITSYLFKDLDVLKSIAKEYFNYYNSLTGLRQSATVSVIETKELGALASKMKDLILKTKKPDDTLVRSNVQRMDFSTTFPVPQYDFLDFLNKNFDQLEATELILQLDKMVKYTAHTPYFLGNKIETSSGVTTHIPNKEDKNLNYYKKLKWYTAAGYNQLFDK